MAPRPRPVVLDHNFPEPIVKAVAKYMPDISFRWVRELNDDWPNLDDHDLIYEIHRAGFSVMVTENYKMASDPRVMVAVEQTRLSVLTGKKMGDDPVFATGVLLRDLVPLLRQDVPKGQFFILNPSHTTPRRARALIENYAEEHDTDPDDVIRSLTRPFRERTRFKEDDPRRLVVYREPRRH